MELGYRTDDFLIFKSFWDRLALNRLLGPRPEVKYIF